MGCVIITAAGNWLFWDIKSNFTLFLYYSYRTYMCVKLAVTWHQIKLNYCDVADLSPLVSDFSPEFKTYQQPQNQGRTVHVIRLFLSHTGSGFGRVLMTGMACLFQRFICLIHQSLCVSVVVFCFLVTKNKKNIGWCLKKKNQERGIYPYIPLFHRFLSADIDCI